MEIQRTLQLEPLLNKKSFFLFGPRSTGKTHLIERQLATKALIIDLLSSDFYLRLQASPGELPKIVSAADHDKIIVIDEIQKVPALLNEVHRLIERQKYRFLLTGSSARKLRRESANLLGGRAWTANLFPLTFFELKNHFELQRYLLFGGLPQVYLSENPLEELAAYIQNYLLLEIQAEGLIRNLPQFSRFLYGAALSNGQLINFSNIASDTGIPASTIREYYSILEDTLVGFLLEPWIESKKRKAIATAKFYFFDCGISNFIGRIKHLDPHSNLYGNSFEHFIGMELRAYLSYRRHLDPFYFWRSVNKQEVDFIIGNECAIEVKSTTHVSRNDLKGLRALTEEAKLKDYFLVSQDTIEKKENEIHCIHWEKFLEKLWADEIITG